MHASSFKHFKHVLYPVRTHMHASHIPSNTGKTLLTRSH